jgi:hypothetical protein
MKIYVKDYQKMDLTIPTFIWNNKKINGYEKQIIALLYKLTTKGMEQQKYLTRMIAKANHDEEEAVVMVIDGLVKKGYVTIDIINKDRYINVKVTKLMTKADQDEPAANELFPEA